jgi:preprotein translocase subunit SecG
MSFDTGTIVIIVVIVIFYVRVLLMQRGKSRRAKLMAGKSRRAIKRAAAKGNPDAIIPKSGVQVVSWYLVFASIAIILGGFVLRTTTLAFKDWWWVFMSAGIALLGMNIY